MKLQRAELKKARIEIIPMIDTIFFLLVFFMITSLTKIQMQAHKVALPQSSTAEGKPIEKVVITVSKEGDYYFNRQQVPFDQILPQLQDVVKDNPNTVVVLNADKDQNVGEFEKLMDIAKQANPTVVMIATAPKAGGK